MSKHTELVAPKFKPISLSLNPCSFYYSVPLSWASMFPSVKYDRSTYLLGLWGHRGYTTKSNSDTQEVFDQ